MTPWALPWRSVLYPSDSSGQPSWLNNPDGNSAVAAQEKEEAGGTADVPASSLIATSARAATRRL
jgi:hypothetical protein